MTRHVLTVDLRDDPAAIDAYVAHHRNVWPEVLGSLRRAGVRDMTIYMLDRRLVMVVDIDGSDLRRAFAQHMAAGARVAEWETLMRGLIQPAPGSVPGDWWSAMEPIFRLQQQDASRAAPGGPR
jgi:L-rhamnose mutarotase